MQFLDPGSPNLRSIVRAGDRLMWGQGAAEPLLLTRALMAQRESIGAIDAFIGTTWADALQVGHADTVRFSSYCGAGPALL